MYNDEDVGKYILIRTVVPVLLLILAGVLYCSVVASFAHDGESFDSKDADNEAKDK